jgi:hypothetical protein
MRYLLMKFVALLMHFQKKKMIRTLRKYFIVGGAMYKIRNKTGKSLIFV